MYHVLVNTKATTLTWAWSVSSGSRDLVLTPSKAFDSVGLTFWSDTGKVPDVGSKCRMETWRGLLMSSHSWHHTFVFRLVHCLHAGIDSLLDLVVF